MRWRVVCGLSETIASFTPTRRLSSVDLPAFGRPTSATKPERVSALTVVLVTVERLELADAHAVNAPALGLEHLDGRAVELEALAHRRHAADAREHPAADRLESVRLDLDAQTLGQVADADLRAEHVRAFCFLDDRLRLGVVL